jgi:hypothetical protein
MFLTAKLKRELAAYAWSNEGAIPPFEKCKSGDIKWLASSQTAAALGVTLLAADFLDDCKHQAASS